MTAAQLCVHKSSALDLSCDYWEGKRVALSVGCLLWRIWINSDPFQLIITWSSCRNLGWCLRRTTGSFKSLSGLSKNVFVSDWSLKNLHITWRVYAILETLRQFLHSVDVPPRSENKDSPVTGLVLHTLPALVFSVSYQGLQKLNQVRAGTNTAALWTGK